MKISFLTIIISFLFPYLLGAHCQIPCGIYDDQARFNTIEEHIVTIEKSMKMLNKDGMADNQYIRWVINKEQHADAIRDIIVNYFLQQRVKLPSASSSKDDYVIYQAKLETLHNMLLLLVRSKQTTDTDVTFRLKNSIKEFKKAYF